MTFVTDHYLWFKALHIIMAFAWMAGLFYLPRLLVYHTQTEVGSTEYRRFVTMEGKLLGIIMGPACIATWAFGLLDAWAMGYWFDLWFLSKMALAVPMTLVHLLNLSWARAFAAGRNRHSERFFRMWNEAPTLLMIAIVFLAVIKPL